MFSDSQSSPSAINKIMSCQSKDQRLRIAVLAVPKSPSPEVAQVAWMNHFRSRSACSPSLSVHSLPEQTPVFSKLE